MMNRRELITALMGFVGVGAVSGIYGAETFLAAGENPKKSTKLTLSKKDISLLDEIGETIIPTTPGSPGAKAAKVGEFMQATINAYYLDSEQKIFELGLSKFDEASRKKYQKDFLSLSDQQKYDLLMQLENDPQATHYQMVKQLTVWGYFTSETGMKTARDFIPIPGRFAGCIKIEPGHKAMAI